MNTDTMIADQNALLQVQDLSVQYGQVKALEHVSFGVNRNEIVAMVGPNGAGKSTALKAVTGILETAGGEITDGSILFEGQHIRGHRTDQLVKKGMCLIPEGRHVFPTLTVRENLEMGSFTVMAKERYVVKERMEKVFGLFPVLFERHKQKAGTLSSGEQQMLAIGKALMLKPKLLLADEPSLGLSPNFVDLIFGKLLEINKDGTSLLVVEQNASMALEIAHRGYVFEIGKIVLEDRGETLLQSEEVKKTFLGA